MDVTVDYLKDSPINVGKFYRYDCLVTPYPIKDKHMVW
jgi:hypothetical protein